MSSEPDTPESASRDGWEWHVPASPDPAASAAPPEHPAGGGGRGGRGGLIALAAVLVVAVMIAALVTALGGGDDPEPSQAPTCADSQCDAGGDHSPEAPQEMEIPDDHLGVVSLGALTPRPEGPWSDYTGPGADELLAEDAHAVNISHTSSWISYFMVGRLGEFALDADPEDLEGTAVEIIDTWVFDYPYSGTTGLERSEPDVSATSVDGNPAVLLETRVSWQSLQSSPDMYEDVALLLVDPGDGGIFLGTAAVPESGTAHYETAVDALMRTTFQHGTYVP